MKKRMLLKLLGDDRRLTEEEKNKYIEECYAYRMRSVIGFQKSKHDFYEMYYNEDLSLEAVKKYINLDYCKLDLQCLKDDLIYIERAVKEYFGLAELKAYNTIKVIDRELQNEIFELINVFHEFIKNNKLLYEKLNIDTDIINSFTEIHIYDHNKKAADNSDITIPVSIKLMTWLMFNIRTDIKNQSDLFIIMNMLVTSGFDII